MRLHSGVGMGQVAAMGLFWQFLGRVLAFTFRGSVRQTDSWQIVAGGTALPSIGLGIIYSIAGQEMPTIEQAEWATYFGYGLLTWLAIRFLLAPFFIWREQYEEAASLRRELSKPERMVLERLTKHRAKARAKLSSELEDWQALAFTAEWDAVAQRLNSEYFGKAMRLQAEAGLSEAFVQARRHFAAAIKEEGEEAGHRKLQDRQSERLLRLMQKHLMGELTAEALALQLPKDTAPETPP